MRIIKKLKGIIKYTYQDNLYRNAGYLMLNNIANGIMGFLLLIIITRLYSSSDLGIFSALFAAANLIILFSLSGGFGNTIIRFFPTLSQIDKQKLIFSFFIINILIIISLSLIFIFFVDIFSPKSDFLKNQFYGFVFILFTFFLGIFTLFTFVFMAIRKTQYILIGNMIANIGKFVFLPLFVSLSYTGIFYSSVIGTFISTIFCLFFLYKIKIIKSKIKIHFDYILTNLKIHFDYILTSYFSSIASVLPGLLFPILIINFLSAEMTAYFFIVWTIFSTISEMIMSLIRAYLVEGSYDEDKNKKSRNKTLKVSLIIATICIFGIFLFGKFILSIFGNEYVITLDLLYIFMISIYLFIANKIYATILLINKKIKEIVVFNFLIAISTLLFGTLLMFYFGLIGIGYGWLIGQVIGIIWILTRLTLRSINKL